MKRSSAGIKDIATFENAEKAYKKARKCKRYRQEVLRFTADKEAELLELIESLETGTYKQGSARRFVVYEPKKRNVYALPFRDRVAQHMINNAIEPVIEKRFYYHSYACRKGKGTHKAAEFVQECIRNLSFEGQRVFVLKGDIHKYFDSVNHEILKGMLCQIFKDKELLKLLFYIIDSYGVNTGIPADEDILEEMYYTGTKEEAYFNGIPVGNLLSQLFANLVLNKLDIYVKDDLKEKLYARQMDDFIIVGSDKEKLEKTLREIEAFLKNELKLQLNPKTQILDAKNGVDFCGYRIYKDHKKLRKRSVKRIKAAIKAYRHGKIIKEKLLKIFVSWEGHAEHADTYMLRQKIREQIGTEIKIKELNEDGSRKIRLDN